MPAPPPPPRKTPRAAPYQPIPLLPKLAGLQAMLNELAKSERMTQLVDYLDDLRKEFDAVAAELASMGFCTPCYLSGLDEDGGHDCIERGC